MTVWVVMEDVPYEGEWLLAIYSTKEAAERRAAEEREKHPHLSYYDVYEETVLD